MPELSVLREKAEMFERRAERATDPISKRHYQEMPPTTAGCSWNISTWNRMKRIEFRLPRVSFFLRDGEGSRRTRPRIVHSCTKIGPCPVARDDQCLQKQKTASSASNARCR
jgi:hypothetical protein